MQNTRGFFCRSHILATRLRQRFSLRGYHAALKAQHAKTLAATVQALRRKPYHLATRLACLRLAGHKRTPPGHRIATCAATFGEQVCVCVWR